MNSYIKVSAIVAIVATLGTISAMTTIVQIAKAEGRKAAIVMGNTQQVTREMAVCQDKPAL